MKTGLLAGLLWGLDTVILGVALTKTPFISTEQAVALAPFVSTFLHDFCSSVWMLIYMGFKKEYGKVVRAFKTKSGKFIILGSLLGGPVGMSGYVAAINFIGPGYTSVISAIFPAIGAFLAFVFLKEKMEAYQIAGLLISIAGVIGLGYTPGGATGENFLLGFGCAVLCVIGWASEAVICAYGMKDPDISDEQALQIRQLASAVFYGVVILNVLSGWKFTLEVTGTTAMKIIAVSALFGTASYVCYYRAINHIGASKAMALNITYSAWAIVFGAVLLGDIPSVRSIILGLLIVAGSITAACDLKEFIGKRS
jgi:drug/metabolite transporter (DMT)-like permease